MASIIPAKLSEKVDWLNLFKHQFAELADNLGFTVEEVENIENACNTIIYSINLAYRARNYSIACTEFRNSMLRKNAKNVRAMGAFNTVEPPAQIFAEYPVLYIEKIVRRVRGNAKYTVGTGLQLGIIPPKSSALLSEAKPKVKLSALTNSVVRINWKKGKAQGIAVESQYAGETKWKEIGRDFYSPFIDARHPLEAGKPELRYYRFNYLMHDKYVGITSDIYSITTNP